MITHIQTDEQNRNLLINHLLVSGDFLCIKQFVAGGLLWRWDQERKHETESQDEMIGLINYIFNSCCSPGWVCAQSWCRRPWRSGRWRTERRPLLQSHERQRWNEGFSKCLPRTGEADWKNKHTEPHTFSFLFFADAFLLSDLQGQNKTKKLTSRGFFI